jgi:hypothetical protein
MTGFKIAALLYGTLLILGFLVVALERLGVVQWWKRFYSPYWWYLVTALILYPLTKGPREDASLAAIGSYFVGVIVGTALGQREEREHWRKLLDGAESLAAYWREQYEELRGGSREEDS